MVGVGAWRSLVAHLHGAQEVAGSNPAVPTMCLILKTFFTLLHIIINDFLVDFQYTDNG